MIGVIETRSSKLAEKIRETEVEISSEKGEFVLFALIEREDSLGKWDIVISAKWIEDKKKEVIEFIASNLKNKLNEEEQLMLSRIVVLSPNDPFVKSLNMIGVEHGTVRISNNNFNGVFIKEGYLITSKT
ncbi:MAG: hypothetical protein M3405_13950 [Acidobacteriota bacterium]|jgi:hypothetical protein|nr:hypothetical protein [Acidobacteriota bacterium]